MKKRALLAVPVVLALIATAYVAFFRPSDEDRIRAVLTRLAKVVEVKSDDNILARAGRLKSTFKEIVADDVRVYVEELNLDVAGRAKLVESATQAGAAFGSASVELASLTIKMEPGATGAKVDGVAIVTATRGGERKTDRRDVHFLLRNDDGWKVTSIEVLAPAASQ